MIDRLEELLAVEATADGQYLAEPGPRLPSLAELAAEPRILTPPFDLRNVFLPGSYTMSLAVVVAATTLDRDDLVPLSAHSTFLRAGTTAEAVRITIERTHDGGRFARRRVALVQDDRSIFTCDVGFHHPDELDDGWQRDAPGLPDPESLATAPSSFPLPIMEVRPLGGPDIDAGRDVTFPLWARFPRGVPDSPAWSAAAMSFAADYFPAQSMLLTSGRSPDTHFARTLEHSMWFHRSVEPSQWMQVDYEPVSVADQRYHAAGTIADRDGTLAATMTQVGIMLPTST